MGSTITIDFHGDPLAAILDDTRGTLIPLRPLVTGMGLDWSAQLKRVKRDPILGPVVVMMATTASPAGDKDGACLPLDFVAGFLFRIDAARVADAVRPKVLAYQRECFRVLADACLGRAPQPAEVVTPAAMVAPDARMCLRLVIEARHTFGAQPARELWFRLGLPAVPSMLAPPRQHDLFTYRREA